MTQNSQQPARTAYSAMGYGRSDYEACYAYSTEWGLNGLHCHDFYEIYIHFQGAKFYCMDNQVYPLGSCDMMVIPPFRLHGLIGDHVTKNYERAFLYISPTMLKSCGAGLIDLDLFFRLHSQNGLYHIHLSDEEGQQCKDLLAGLMQTQSGTSALERFSSFTKLVQFLNIACEVMNRSDKSTEPIVVNEAMQDVLAYINEHYTTPIKLDNIARQFGVSVSFLSHEFVKYTGRSVYDYVLYRRVLLAKELISSGRPLNEVAYHCGFNDYSSFLRSFTKMTGMSPSAYRKGQPALSTPL